MSTEFVSAETDAIIAHELLPAYARPLPKPVAATFTVKVVTLGQDGSFDFLSSVPGVAAFRLTTYGGAASKSMMNVPPGAYTVVQTKNTAGFELQSVQCSSARFHGAAASVSIDNGTNSACTFTQGVASDVSDRRVDESAGSSVSLRLDALGAADPKFDLLASAMGAGRFARASLSLPSDTTQPPSLP